MSPEIPPSFGDTRPELLILDVDGVLTPNQIFVSEEGGEWKPFFVPDGTGLKLLLQNGVQVALISGRPSRAVEHRARELGIAHCETGVRAKGRAVTTLLERTGVSPSAAVYAGDDLIDLAAMGEVGLPVAVRNAHPEVIRRAVAVTHREGGRGAVREICEWILRARGDWEHVLEGYLE
ncbi:MAG: KdsC family phosphatase [Planctomycetota bacterium]